MVGAVRELAKHVCDKVDFMRKNTKEFDHLFPNVEPQKDCLSGFTGAVSEANYIDRAESFLTDKEAHTNAIQVIERVKNSYAIIYPSCWNGKISLVE